MFWLCLFLDTVAVSRHLHGDNLQRLANKQGDTFEDDWRWKSWPRRLRKQGFLMWERMKPDLDMIAHGEKLRCIFGRFFSMNISYIQAETGFIVDQVDHVKSVSATTWSCFFLLPSTSVLVTLCLMSMKPCARSENPSHEPASNPAKACESRGVFHSGNAKHFSDCHGSGFKLSLEESYLTKIWRILGVREWKESCTDELIGTILQWLSQNERSVTMSNRIESWPFFTTWDGIFQQAQGFASLVFRWFSTMFLEVQRFVMTRPAMSIKVISRCFFFPLPIRNTRIWKNLFFVCFAGQNSDPLGLLYIFSWPPRCTQSAPLHPQS